MSNESPKGGFTPTVRPGKFTLEEIKEFASFVKTLLADQPAIKWSIIAAGIGGALDSLHMLWLFLAFLKQSAK